MIAIAFHFRIGDARKGGGGCDADAGDEREQRIADHRGDGQTAGNFVQQTVDAPIDVGDGSRLADEFPHQHKQGNNGENIGTDGFVSRCRQHSLDRIEGVGVGAGDEKNAQRAGYAQRDGDMDTDGDQADQTDNQQNGGIYFKHGYILDYF